MTILIRAVEPADYQGIHQIFLGPKVIWGTLQIPFPSAEMWRKRLAEPSEETVRLVACIEQDLGAIGYSYLSQSPAPPTCRPDRYVGP